MPLIFGVPGKEYEIVSILGGRGFVKKLLEMDIRPGKVIRVIANSFSGPILLTINDSRIGIGRGMAGKILVRTFERRG